MLGSAEKLILSKKKMKHSTQITDIFWMEDHVLYFLFVRFI